MTGEASLSRLVIVRVAVQPDPFLLPRLSHQQVTLGHVQPGMTCRNHGLTAERGPQNPGLLEEPVLFVFFLQHLPASMSQKSGAAQVR